MSTIPSTLPASTSQNSEPTLVFSPRTSNNLEVLKTAIENSESNKGIVHLDNSYFFTKTELLSFLRLSNFGGKEHVKQLKIDGCQEPFIDLNELKEIFPSIELISSLNHKCTVIEKYDNDKNYFNHFGWIKA